MVNVFWELAALLLFKKRIVLTFSSVIAGTPSVVLRARRSSRVRRLQLALHSFMLHTCIIAVRSWSDESGVET